MARPHALLLFVAAAGALLLLLACAVTTAHAQPPPLPPTRRRFGGGRPPLLGPRPPRSLPRGRGPRPPPRLGDLGGGDEEGDGDGAAPAVSPPSYAPASLPPPLAPEPPRESATQTFCASSSSSSSFGAPTLASPDPSVGGAFGASAALDGPGDVLVVGAPGEGIDPSFFNPAAAASLTPQGYAPAGAGAAYVAFRQGACRWSPPQYLPPPPAPTAGSGAAAPLGVVAFGAAVAAAADGATLLVGGALLRRPDQQQQGQQQGQGGGYVRPVVAYVADAQTGDRVRQEAGEGGEGAAAAQGALLAARDAGAVAAAVLSGDARAAMARGAVAAGAVAVAAAQQEQENGGGGSASAAVFSRVASVFVGGAGGAGGGYSRAGGLPIQLPRFVSGDNNRLQLTGGLRLSLSSDGRTAVASLHALYAPSMARGQRLASPAPLLGAVMVFSSPGGGPFELRQSVAAPPSASSSSSDGRLWGAAHALSDDGRALAVLSASSGSGAGADAIHVFARGGGVEGGGEEEGAAAGPFAADQGGAIELGPGEQAASLALSADGGALAVGLASGQAVLLTRGAAAAGAAAAASSSSSPSSSWVRRCTFEAGGAAGAPAEVRLASAGGNGDLRLVASAPGSPARVFAVAAGGDGCASGRQGDELGGGGEGSWRQALGAGGRVGGGGGPLAVSRDGRYAAVGAPGASLDERLPGSGGLFSYVV